MDEHALRALDAGILRLAEGDRRAGSSVFAALWPELVAFAERALGKGPDADDAAQLALEKVFAQAVDYDPQRAALPWALAITAWECRTIVQRRRRRREEPLEAGSEAVAEGADPEAAALERNMLTALREAVSNLSLQDQKTLQEAFAREVEAPATPAFRKRKERALVRLRTAWRRLYGD